MNEKQKGIKASSKVISVIMKIGYIAMIVEMCICAVNLLFVAITGKTSIITDNVKIITTGENATPKEVIALCVSALIVGAFLFAIFYLTQRMFDEICVTLNPFNKKYVRTIKIVGILVAAMTVVSDLVNTLASLYAGSETLGFETDITGVIFGVIIFCLAYIFDYGCTLQKQSEETL